MNLPEFKAWFEGYTEDLKDAPTAKQWKRVKEQVAKIDGTPITTTIYRDHYWPRVWPYWERYHLGTGGVSFTAGAAWQAATQNYSAALNARGSADGIGNISFEAFSSPEPVSNDFDAIPHMFAAGKADALSDAA